MRVGTVCEYYQKAKGIPPLQDTVNAVSARAKRTKKNAIWRKLTHVLTRTRREAEVSDANAVDVSEGQAVQDQTKKAGRARR